MRISRKPGHKNTAPNNKELKDFTWGLFFHSMGLDFLSKSIGTKRGSLGKLDLQESSQWIVSIPDIPGKGLEYRFQSSLFRMLCLNIATISQVSN